MKNPAARKVRIERWCDGEQKTTDDLLAVEEPLEIRVNNQPVSVTMRTPGHDEELVAGFLFAEGIIRSRKAIERIEPHPRNRHGNIINVILEDDRSVDWKRLKRSFASLSSCGLCGRESIDVLKRRVPGIKSSFALRESVVASFPAKLLRDQSAFTDTGGLHAAGLFDARGRLTVVREDIGRHNAVDKVIGWGVLNNKLPFSKRAMLVSGRASFEIVQKTLVAGIPMLCAISAPSNLAVELSRSGGQTLVGFIRDRRMNVYSASDRIVSAG